MSDILQYLAWRGDISLAERPFNDVDNLLLSELAYIDFSHIAKRNITLREFYAISKDVRMKAVSNLEFYPQLLERMAQSRRFSEAILLNYIDIFDEEQQTQFAALHIALDDGNTYIAFRGTDQTILGWKEDFAMSFQTVPAQEKAVRYLKETMLADKKYHIGGHSKGGNLAIYAAAMCGKQRQRQILTVYTNDGLGFQEDFLQTSEYAAIREKIRRIIPEFSVIGNLLCQDVTPIIVQSSAEGMLQHAGSSWRIEGDSFLTADALSPECKMANRIFSGWIDDVSMEERSIFVDEFFGSLESSGTKNINAITEEGADGMEAVVDSMVHTKWETKLVIGKFIRSLFTRIAQADFGRIFDSKQLFRGAALVLLGLLFTRLPTNAVQIISFAGVLLLILFAAKRILHHFSKGENMRKKRFFIFFYSVAIAVFSLVLAQKTILLISANFALGVLACVYAYFLYKRNNENRKNKLWFAFVLLRVLAVVLLGTVLMVASNPSWAFTFTAGTFALLEGIIEICNHIAVKVRRKRVVQNWN